MQIHAADQRDLAAVRELLRHHDLPLDGIDDHVQTMIVAKDGPSVVGAAAIELYADGGLLRSVVVDAARQGHGIGQALIEAVLDMARTRGLCSLFLLTTTAERYFPRFGFEPISRSDVPESVQSSVEFQSACPATAVVMRKRLRVCD
jgi:amino-acid N-acetyltransferase